MISIEIICFIFINKSDKYCLIFLLLLREITMEEYFDDIYDEDYVPMEKR